MNSSKLGLIIEDRNEKFVSQEVRNMIFEDAYWLKIISVIGFQKLISEYIGSFEPELINPARAAGKIVRDTAEEYKNRVSSMLILIDSPAFNTDKFIMEDFGNECYAICNLYQTEIQVIRLKVYASFDQKIEDEKLAPNSDQIKGLAANDNQEFEVLLLTKA